MIRLSGFTLRFNLDCLMLSDNLKKNPQTKLQVNPIAKLLTSLLDSVKTEFSITRINISNRVKMSRSTFSEK